MLPLSKFAPPTPPPGAPAVALLARPGRNFRA